MIAVTGVGEVGAPLDVTRELGERGYKYLLPASRHLLAATRRAVAGGGRLDRVPADRRGVAVGSSTAVREYFTQAMTATRQEDLSPARAPYFAINALTTRVSSEHQLKAFSLTCTSPGVAGFEAIELGARALATGRADVMVVAAMEETGAVAMIIEPGGTHQPRLLARTAFAPPDLVTSDRGRRRLLADAADIVQHARPRQVHAVVDDSPVAEAVVRAVTTAGDGVAPVVTAPGAGGCLSPMTLLSHLLRTARENTLVITATAEGHYAFGAFLPGVPPC
ncbi:beta-ketoacyl synthase N-terminal-like domain-containing protein [Nonomuraea sp. SBT364]|uniref:beta-ketoacyl synthase N-terminal-like domain-containing protein n=1 Tax=Nonomuraea sp. SBT364 TaxID=1580530 RepID=UPI00066BBA24|nr:beta-ketoacyl synthase N-terminal-like domain-containing protein [Nonomuraea sp. SBT364]